MDTLSPVLPNGRDRHPDRYQLFTPLGQPQDVTAADGRVAVRFTEYPGAYRLKGNRGGPVVRGFSVNLPQTASQLTRLSKGELDQLLGPDRYHFARSQDEIVLGVGEAAALARSGLDEDLVLAPHQRARAARKQRDAHLAVLGFAKNADLHLTPRREAGRRMAGEATKSAGCSARRG